MIASKPGAVSREELVEFVAGYVQFFDDSARMVAAFLDKLRRNMGLRRLPAPPPLFLYELAAILRIGHWQQSSALAELGSKFPTAASLYEDLLQRVDLDAESFCGQFASSRCPLMSQVALLWHQRCSWYAMRELGCDMLMSRLSFDRIAPVIAELIIKNR